MEQHTEDTGRGRRREPPPPVPELMRVTRKQLHVSLHPTMTEGSFNNWLQRAVKDLGFPPPRRTGVRSVTWSVLEVQAWLASRPQTGLFAGRRPGSEAA